MVYDLYILYAYQFTLLAVFNCDKTTVLYGLLA